jgi:hypothetical protein
MTLPQKTGAAQPVANVIERVIIQGDLSGLTAEQRVVYYNRVCDSIGVNPDTQPFEYVIYQGKLKLYARRDCADQLRKIHGINIEIVSQELSDGLLSIHVRAKDKTGRVDEDLGVVPFSDALKGEIRANTVMKAITKAKRRVTLSIAGLGFLDETEVEDIPGAKLLDQKPPAPAPNVLLHDPETGEIDSAAGPAVTAADTAPASSDAQTEAGADVLHKPLSIEDMARQAAERGDEMFRTFYRNRSDEEQAAINKIGPELRETISKAKNLALAATKRRA